MSELVLHIGMTKTGKADPRLMDVNENLDRLTVALERDTHMLLSE